jgi:uncharacterized membrane protein YqaE (UPF0057 family)
LNNVEKQDFTKEESNDLVALVLALILPPVGVAIKRGIDAQFVINVLLTLFGYFPGIIHALYVILKK